MRFTTLCPECRVVVVSTLEFVRAYACDLSQMVVGSVVLITEYDISVCS
jgi:hypothetical protein